MNDESLEILLSAYLDDELSPQERAQVEDRLASDVAYRRLHEELLATRAAMQALPRHQFDHDLSAAVLRRAERAVLGGSHGTERSREPASPLGDWWSRGRSWRMVVWPAAAIAAALLIAWLGTEPSGERNVALDSPAGAVSMSAPTDSATAADQLAPATAAPVESLARDEPGQAAAAAPKPAASPALRQMPQSPAPRYAAAEKAEGVAADRANELVEIDVVTQLAGSRALERWLDEHHIEWKAKSTDEHRDDAEAKRPVASDAREAARAYEVQMTADELAQLRTEMARLGPHAEKLARERRPMQERAPQAAELAASDKKDQARHQVVIRLKVVEPPTKADEKRPASDP